MRLMKILDIANQIEKSSFLKLIDTTSSDLRKSNTSIDKILTESEGEHIKKIDNATVVKLFNLIRPQLLDHYKEQMRYNEMQLGILIDIVIRDGNCIMTREWFRNLYTNEISNLAFKSIYRPIRK